LHSDLVSALSKGEIQETLDHRLPSKAFQSYPKDLTTKEESTRGGIKSFSPLSNKEAIARTEDVMKDLGLRVKVDIQASPGKCNIKYRPVIGGDELDAGQTNISTEFDPKWYVFSCDCKAPPIEQRVDCTQDRKIVFSCQ
jgi:hypothetical protein